MTDTAAPPLRDPKRMEALVRSFAEVLALAAEDAWVPGIAQQLAITLAMGDLIEGADLGDEAQPAPVYGL